MAKKMLPLKVGCLVAFNELDNATWFEVLEINGYRMAIREYHETLKFSTQVFDKSFVKQVKYLD